MWEANLPDARKFCVLEKKVEDTMSYNMNYYVSYQSIFLEKSITTWKEY